MLAARPVVANATSERETARRSIETGGPSVRSVAGERSGRAESSSSAARRPASSVSVSVAPASGFDRRRSSAGLRCGVAAACESLASACRGAVRTSACSTAAKLAVASSSARGRRASAVVASPCSAVSAVAQLRGIGLGVGAAPSRSSAAVLSAFAASASAVAARLAAASAVAASAASRHWSWPRRPQSPRSCQSTSVAVSARRVRLARRRLPRARSLPPSAGEPARTPTQRVVDAAFRLLDRVGHE